MMSCSQHFKRLVISHQQRRMTGLGSGPVLNGTRSRFLHQDPKRPITGWFNKMKDSVLLIEATKGPVAKTACGVAQGAATAAVVFGTGCGLIKLTTLINPKKPATLIEDKDRRLNAEELDKAASKKIGLTYFHMASSLLASSLTALLSFRLFRNKALIVRMGERPLVAIGLGVVTPLAMATIVRYMPPTETKEGVLVPFGLKELGNLFYSGSIGLLAAPLYLLGGQSIHRAIFVTAGTWLGLQGVAHVAPKDALWRWARPISYALNAVLISFILTLILRREHAAFNPLFRLAMHGGILVYSAHYLYVAHTMKEAAKSPNYDPVNAAMALTMDLLSLYGRFAFLLPPHFQLSREHYFVTRGQWPKSRGSTNHNNSHENEKNFKPGNDDMT